DLDDVVVVGREGEERRRRMRRSGVPLQRSARVEPGDGAAGSGVEGVDVAVGPDEDKERAVGAEVGAIDRLLFYTADTLRPAQIPELPPAGAFPAHEQEAAGAEPGPHLLP